MVLRHEQTKLHSMPKCNPVFASLNISPVLLRLSLAGNLEKPLMSHYGPEWRGRDYIFRLFSSLSCSVLVRLTLFKLCPPMLQKKPRGFHYHPPLPPKRSADCICRLAHAQYIKLTAELLGRRDGAGRYSTVCTC
jgi:hypothetical protein